MRRAFCLVSLVSCLVSSAGAQTYPSPQTSARSGRWVRVPRAAPQAAVRELAPPAVRERLIVQRAAPETVVWPLRDRLGYRLGAHIMRKHRPKMVVDLEPGQADAAAFRVVYQPTQEVIAETPAPQEDLVYVPDEAPPAVEEAPVFAPRALVPPKSPPVPSPRAVAPPKARPRALAPPKARPRAVPSPQADDGVPPPPPADGIGEPTATEPVEGEGGW